jgi:hypothetical protein
MPINGIENSRERTKKGQLKAASPEARMDLP